MSPGRVWFVLLGRQPAVFSLEARGFFSLPSGFRHFTRGGLGGKGALQGLLKLKVREKFFSSFSGLS